MEQDCQKGFFFFKRKSAKATPKRIAGGHGVEPTNSRTDHHVIFKNPQKYLLDMSLIFGLNFPVVFAEKYWARFQYQSRKNGTFTTNGKRKQQHDIPTQMLNKTRKRGEQINQHPYVKKSSGGGPSPCPRLPFFFLIREAERNVSKSQDGRGSSCSLRFINNKTKRESRKRKERKAILVQKVLPVSSTSAHWHPHPVSAVGAD